MASHSSGPLDQAGFLSEIASAMADHASAFAYDDFLYLDAVLDHLNDLDALSAIRYDDPLVVAREGGGDCTQLSAHFAATFFEPRGIPCHWVVSSDQNYERSPRSLLVPFRSTALVARAPGGNDLYIGVPLGHLRPLPIYEGAADYFWGKQYTIKGVANDRFSVHTQDGKNLRVREYYRPSFIDFASAWRALVHVKDHYSVTTYFDGVRHYLGYDLNDNRIYYTLGTSRIRSAGIGRFLEIYDVNRQKFEAQFRRPRLERTISRLAPIYEQLRARLIR